MALPVTDSFGTSSTQSLTDYSGNWTSNYEPIWVRDGSDDAQPGSAGGECGDFWNADAFGDDQYSLAIISNDGVGGNPQMGVGVRIHATAETWYGFYTSGDDTMLFIEDDGEWAQLGSSGVAAVETEEIKCTADGTTITGLIDD